MDELDGFVEAFESVRSQHAVDLAQYLPGREQALYRFLKQMQQCERDEEQVRLVLGAVQGSVQADAVYYWDAAAAADPVVLSGQSLLPAGWCRDFVRHAIEKQTADASHLLLPVV